jgi:hypothetical protein
LSTLDYRLKFPLPEVSGWSIKKTKISLKENQAARTRTGVVDMAKAKQQIYIT